MRKIFFSKASACGKEAKQIQMVGSGWHLSWMMIVGTYVPKASQDSSLQVCKFTPFYHIMPSFKFVLFFQR